MIKFIGIAVFIFLYWFLDRARKQKERQNNIDRREQINRIRNMNKTTEE